MAMLQVVPEITLESWTRLLELLPEPRFVSVLVFNISNSESNRVSEVLSQCAGVKLEIGSGPYRLAYPSKRALLTLIKEREQYLEDGIFTVPNVQIDSVNFYVDGVSFDFSSCGCEIKGMSPLVLKILDENQKSPFPSVPISVR